jgi:four helix bundle protein
MKDNIIKQKTFEFSLLIIDLYKQLVIEKEFIISKQLLKSGTSIGANVAESEAAQSKADFISKLSIAAKEARETKYWIDLLQHSELTKLELIKHEEKCVEIIKILTSIIKTSSNT